MATGTFADDAVLKTVTFATVLTRFVRLTAVTEPATAAPGRRPRRSTCSAGPIRRCRVPGGPSPPTARRPCRRTAPRPTCWTATPRRSGTRRGAPTPAAPLPHQSLSTWRAANLVSGLSLPATARTVQERQHRPIPHRDQHRRRHLGRRRSRPARSPTCTTAQTVTFDSRHRPLRAADRSDRGRQPRPVVQRRRDQPARPGRPDADPHRLDRQPRQRSETARRIPAGNVLDGNAATIWHSQWSSTRRSRCRTRSRST